MAILGPSLWGLMSIYTKQLYAVGINAPMICAFRGIVAGLLFILVFSFSDRSAIKIKAKDILICSLFGLFGYGIGYITYITSVECIPVSVATVIMFTCPVWVILMGMILFGEKAEKYKIISIVVCIAGAALVVDLFHADFNGSNTLKGIFLATVNAICAASQIMIPRYFDGKIKKDSFILYGYLASGIIMLPFIDYSSFFGILTGPEGGISLKSLVMLATVCTFVANYCFMNSSTYLHTTLVGILSGFEVVVGTAVGVLYFKEELTLLQFIGAVTIIAAALYPSIIEMKMNRNS